MRKIMIGILIVGFLVLIGCKEEVVCPEIDCPEISCPVCQECREEKSLLDMDFEWGPYIEGGAYFTIAVYNYGFIEAKNVKVKCDIEDKFTTEFFIGNVASTSVKVGEYDNLSINTNEDDYAMCYISDCDDCEVLIDRIPLDDDEDIEPIFA